MFVETKRGADQLEDYLLRHNLPATSIHGDKTQAEREMVRGGGGGAARDAWKQQRVSWATREARPLFNSLCHIAACSHGSCVSRS